MTTKYRETYDVCAYWFVRKESPEQCAEHALKLVDGLSHLDPRFTGFWNFKRVRRKLVRVPMTLEKDEVIRAFARGVNRRETDRSIIEEFGFRFTFVSGARDRRGSSISIRCGCYSDHAPNSCVIHWDQGNDPDPLVEVPSLTKIIEYVVDAWDPDWAFAGSYQYRDAIEPIGIKNKWSIDWLTYIPSRQGRPPPLPAPVRIDPFGDKGMLITLTPERITVSNPEQVALGRRVQELLDRAGLLDKRREGWPAPPP